MLSSDQIRAAPVVHAGIYVDTMTNQFGDVALALIMDYEDGTCSPAHVMSKEMIEAVLADIQRLLPEVTFSCPVVKIEQPEGKPN